MHRNSSSVHTAYGGFHAPSAHITRRRQSVRPGFVIYTPPTRESACQPSGESARYPRAPPPHLRPTQRHPPSHRVDCWRPAPPGLCAVCAPNARPRQIPYVGRIKSSAVRSPPAQMSSTSRSAILTDSPCCRLSTSWVRRGAHLGGVLCSWSAMLL